MKVNIAHEITHESEQTKQDPRKNSNPDPLPLIPGQPMIGRYSLSRKPCTYRPLNPPTIKQKKC